LLYCCLNLLEWPIVPQGLVGDGLYGVKPSGEQLLQLQATA
jgi:hypothetical protein